MASPSEMAALLHHTQALNSKNRQPASQFLTKPGMAFHVACPLTCRKICYCKLGSSDLQTRFGAALGRQNHVMLESAVALGKLLQGALPLSLSAGGETVEVLVPRLSKEARKKKKKITVSTAYGYRNLEDEKFDSGERMRMEDSGNGLEVIHIEGTAPKRKDPHDAAPDQVICDLCSTGELIGSEKEKRMFSCPGCPKRYHRKCLKKWSQHRDLFNWATWRCPSCRSCEVCKRVDDPKKLLFCKRCDGAYHMSCQQPPLKSMPKGAFVCPRHVNCYSCGSHVPGSGISSKWFLSYLFCDACGRLFIKGNYCPICLKVYRESEVSPMICCDFCERWVHCKCDGISEEKFQQFQTNVNLSFKCAACRGECYQVKELDGAVQELWRRRDANEQEAIAHARAAAGILGEDEQRRLCPSSDDEVKPSVHVQEEVPKKGTKHVIKINVKRSGLDEEDKSKINAKKQKTAPNKNGSEIKKLKLPVFSNANSATLDETKKKAESSGKGQVEHKIEKGKQKTEDLAGKSESSKKDKKSKKKKHKSTNDETQQGEKHLPITGTENRGAKDKKSKLVDTPEPDKVQASKVVSGSKPKKFPTPKLLLHVKTRDDGLTKVSAIKAKSKPVKADSSEKEQDSANSQAEEEEPELEERYLNKKLSSGDNTNVTQDEGSFPIHSWGVQSESRRKRQPSAKFRHIDTNKRRRSDGSTNLEPSDDASTAVDHEDGNMPAVTRQTASKLKKGLMITEDTDTSEVSKKRARVEYPEDDDHVSLKHIKLSQESAKKPLKVKFRKQSGIPDAEDNESTPARGQRTTRRRSAILDGAAKDLEYGPCFDIDTEDDTSILQRLGVDAVAKRVEVFRDKAWRKGTIVTVNPVKSQFVIEYDNGHKSTQKYGKEKVRLLSTAKR